MPPSFLEVPYLPMEMIMNNFYYLAIQSLHKTCWDLRNFIDDKKPGINIKRIYILKMTDGVILTISGTEAT
ncbi:hypothetical protein CRE_19874 [Caenorhabditis remanei]|uniref:F-box domain-containing protein n=1 Tax=Caenorhabditis remanei TaxID=31234 RepID=E3MTF2_CAERE|nr:hypothetical protein CRE_19874 [Caenorhabditis remanei]